VCLCIEDRQANTLRAFPHMGNILLADKSDIKEKMYIKSAKKNREKILKIMAGFALHAYILIIFLMIFLKDFPLERCIKIYGKYMREDINS
jgi:hypothetical protein